MLLCNTETCAIFRDGIALYWNSDHLTVEGADLVVGPLIEAIGLRR
ncbi:hypothetical protein LC062_20075 [Stappia indica]|nr:hypothetical protein [Stappia indica]